LRRAPYLILVCVISEELYFRLKVFAGLAQCNACELKENLWLCLTCGSLGCGRQQFGGLGGEGHGLAHFETSGHPVSVKLGTITPEGTAGELTILLSLFPDLPNIPDVYCYACNDSKEDPNIAAHLSTFGINVQNLKKTEKSMTELVSSFLSSKETLSISIRSKSSKT